MCWNCHLHDDHGQLSWSIPTTIGSISGHDSGWWSSIIRITGLEEPKLGNLFCVLWSTSRDFYAITQFLLQTDHLYVFVALLSGYVFTTAAMMIPALSEFDVSLERGRGAVGDEN